MLLWLAPFVAMSAVVLVAISLQPIDDDTLYLIYGSAPPTAATQGLEHALHGALSSTQGCIEEAYRAGLRQRYIGNYAGYFAIADAVRGIFWTGGEGLLAAQIAAKAGIMLVFAALLAWAIARTRSDRPRAALVLAAMVYALIEIAGLTGIYPRYARADVGDLKGLFRLSWNVIASHNGHSLLGHTPRAAALLLFAAALVLRWNHRDVAAALAVAAVGALHQSYGGLALAFYCVSGALSRPSCFKSGVARLLLGASLISFVLRESYFGQSPGMLASAGLTAACVAAAVAGFAFVRSHRFAMLRTRAVGRIPDDPVLIDALVLGALAALLTLTSVFAGLASDPVTRQYTWSNLALRVWSFVRFPLLVGFCLWLAARFPPLQRVRRVALAGAVLVGLIGAAAFDRDFASRQSAEYRAALIAHADAALFFPRDEAWLYAHLAIAAASGRDADLVRRALAKRPLLCGRTRGPR